MKHITQRIAVKPFLKEGYQTIGKSRSLAFCAALVLFAATVQTWADTVVVNPTWERSSGGTGITYNADPPDPQGLQAALDLPTDITGDASVWEQSGSWTYWNWGGCGGGVGLGIHFKGAFTLTAADLASITSAKLIDPLVTPGRLPINDRLVTWVNTTFVGSVVPDRLWDDPTVPYTIGWHAPAQEIPVSYLHEGVNTIDVVGAELCGDGGMGKLALSFELTAPVNQPPVATAAAPSIASIWPPNNKMVAITINGVTDPDGDAVTITITNITNNETGAADAAGIGTSTAQVRATRNGKGTGRTYTISFTADDGKGGMASGSVIVVVPHDQGKRAKPTAVESATWGEVKSSEQ